MNRLKLKWCVAIDIGIIQSYKKVSNETNNDRFGHNYNYYERKENKKESKVGTHQRMREPIQIKNYRKEIIKENNIK